MPRFLLLVIRVFYMSLRAIADGVAIHNVFADANKYIMTGLLRFARNDNVGGARVTGMTWLFQRTGGCEYVCAGCVRILRVCRCIHNA